MDQPRAELGPTEIQRRVWSNGIVRVAYQAVSVGRQYAGRVVTIRLEGSIRHVFLDGRPVRSIPRTNRWEVKQIRSKGTTTSSKAVSGGVKHHLRPFRQASGETGQGAHRTTQEDTNSPTKPSWPGSEGTERHQMDRTARTP